MKGQVQHMKHLLLLSTQTVTSVVEAVEMEAHANRAGPKPAETQQHRWLLFIQLALRHMETEIISEVISA